MDAPALRAPGGSVVDVAKGVPKPRTWHAATEGSVATFSGSAGPGLCRRATKPRRGCIAGPVIPRLARVGWMDAAVRGCRDMSLKEHESAWGADPRPSGRVEVRKVITRRA